MVKIPLSHFIYMEVGERHQYNEEEEEINIEKVYLLDDYYFAFNRITKENFFGVKLYCCDLFEEESDREYNKEIDLYLLENFNIVIDYSDK